MSRLQRSGLGLGIIIFTAMRFAPAPTGLSDTAWAIAALTLLMGLWWLTEALPLAATALLPIVLVPWLGAGSAEDISSSYAHPLIFLFLGGFFIAEALQRWGLHQRIAILVLQASPQSVGGLVAALMLATAFLSMWISNTATAMLMIPIAQSIAHALNRSGSEVDNKSDEISATLILSVAFSATVGGMASLIGTPPNALLAAYLLSSHDIRIGFGQWMLLGLPLASAILFVTWFVLTRLLSRSNLHSNLNISTVVNDLSADLQPLSNAGRLTAWIAGLTGLMLLLRPLLQHWFPSLTLSDPGIVISAAVVLFALPAFDREGTRLLRWQDAKSIRWDVLLLFGGGIALASAIHNSGLAQSVGNLAYTLTDWPSMLVILLLMTLVVYMSELASNTAMAAVFLPIVGAAAGVLDIGTLELVLPIGIAASLGFMLPVSTPPNAIAFGTGAVSYGQMIRAGAVLDIIAIPIVYLMTILLGRFVITG